MHALTGHWILATGAWTIHIVIIAVLKIFYDSLPGVSQETSWTLTNISYTVVSAICPSRDPATLGVRTGHFGPA